MPLDEARDAELTLTQALAFGEDHVSGRTSVPLEGDHKAQLLLLADGACGKESAKA